MNFNASNNYIMNYTILNNTVDFMSLPALDITSILHMLQTSFLHLILFTGPMHH